ncbi:tRNA (guanosine(46)-N7)-methyltransferase TrmB [Flavihumibacter sp. CACIAM 22H1]|uniref:tRNA (guanosine(46)-N7)-methyltransferase TrmB n=1 Tax=Flavihumibacter sp. CACIAM 22H1 TaxID=1812911 RepID=UPI0007A90A6E|nr:tRNA (guanosine(46)-N7)-methyltransferase TrmB [Flavihumibacter sp. CACIAM 22H1]KYP13102.1 MAG: tRNA (guanine(46)-N(7))-methyltransferase [Flavihumibacter sp. CACIAM 22H1]
MGQKKLIRFEAIKGFSNVFQYPEGMAGKWKDHFGNPNPITLELACGKGEYTVGLAARYPGKNFIGVDVKGNRIYVGAKKCLENDQQNAAFLRTKIDQISSYFAPQEVEAIWITFPDPQLRRSRHTKRLTHPKFLRKYQQLLQPKGIIHLKTDSPVLFQFTCWVIELYGLELVSKIEDLYAEPVISPELAIKTHYEGLDIAKSNRIHYLSFRLPEAPLPDYDEKLHELVFHYEKATD